jgi:signal peptidase II
VTEVDPALDAEPTEPVEAPAPRPPRKLLLLAAVAVTTAVLDQLTKTWAQDRLSGGRMLHVVGSLHFNLTYNTGAAFSQGSGKGLGPWISLFAIVVVVAISLGSTSRQRLGALASGLIAGGAVGNLIDRAVRGDAGFLHGAVIDFIDLQWWPIFNLADSGVVVGAFLLVLASFRAPAS